MDIQKFEYVYSEYATTNPPRSHCVSYAVQNFTDSSVELNYYTSDNGVENEKTFTLDGAEFSEIINIINGGAVSEIEAQTPFERNPQFMQMCGGNVAEGINIIKSAGEELHTKTIPPTAQRLVRYLAELVKKYA